MTDTELDSLLTVGDLIRWGASQFRAARLHFGHGTDNSADEARVLVFHALALENAVPEYFYRSRITTSERQAAVALLRRRIDERKPVPYLTGEAWFAGLSFRVTEQVLIPRSPLAELIEGGFSPWCNMDTVGHILDMCTGGGCIAVACAAHWPAVRVDAVDVSRAALDVADDNIRDYGIGDRVATIQSDLFNDLPARQYDIVVGNPPYVPADRLRALPPEYGHEPELALVAGSDGLTLVDRILRDAAPFVAPGGILVVEVGESAPAVRRRYPDLPFTWLDFGRGGEGVFLLTGKQLRESGLTATGAP